MRTKRALAVLVVAGAVAAPGALAFSGGRAPSPAAAAAAFVHLLHHRFGDVRGYATCPAAQTVNGRINCLAEIHTSRLWHQVSASARLRNGKVILTGSFRSWVRRWSPYSRAPILVTGESRVSGVASVNGPAYDWGFLALCAHELQEGQTRRCNADDGYSKGFSRFYLFTCSRQGALTSCRNALGDAMRYRRVG